MYQCVCVAILRSNCAGSKKFVRLCNVYFLSCPQFLVLVIEEVHDFSYPHGGLFELGFTWGYAFTVVEYVDL